MKKVIKIIQVPVSKKTKAKEVIQYQDISGRLHNTEKQCLRADVIIKDRITLKDSYTDRELCIGDYTTIRKVEVKNNIDLVNKYLAPFNYNKQSSILKPGVYYVIKTIESVGSYDPDYEIEILTEENFNLKYLSFFNN